MRSLRFIIILMALLPGVVALGEQMQRKGKGMQTVSHPDIQVLYSPDLKMGTGPEDGDLLVCLYAPATRILVCMSPEEFEARAADFGF